MSVANTETGAPDPARYWEQLVSRATCCAMIEKYEALAALESTPPGPEQTRRLRAAAATWPGSLRESQLAGPTRCRERLQALRDVVDDEARTRARWRARGRADVPLWADLHLLLGDQLGGRAGWRARQRARGRDALIDFLACADRTEARHRWPRRPEVLIAVAGAAVRPRQAYLWLAARAGLALPELNQLLFARSGPWDRRAGDPIASGSAS